MKYILVAILLIVLTVLPAWNQDDNKIEIGSTTMENETDGSISTTTTPKPTVKAQQPKMEKFDLSQLNVALPTRSAMYVPGWMRVVVGVVLVGFLIGVITGYIMMKFSDREEANRHAVVPVLGGDTESTATRATTRSPPVPAAAEGEDIELPAIFAKGGMAAQARKAHLKNMRRRESPEDSDEMAESSV